MTKNVLKTIRLTSSALAMTLALCAAPSAFAEARTYNFSIPAESTAKALMDFSRQAKIQILFPYEVVADHTSPAISGEYDRATVLKLLLDGSGLEIARETDQVITLKAVGAIDKTSSLSDPDAPTEVIVTGTHIRGGNPTSPVHTVTRKDIEQSGYSQIGDVMRSLPENFSGGQNPQVFNGAGANVANNNKSNASSVNLRGLGSDATLVLVNGHRLSADSTFQGADISGLPLAAVERIEVVTDGASAIYGSDAVAGVANFIMRRHYDGTELSARIAGATQGGGGDFTYSLLTGRSNADGFALLNYEYDDQAAIRLGQRDSAPGVAINNTLLQPQRRQSMFVSAGRTLTDRVSVSFDGMVSDRQTTGVFQQDISSTQYLTSIWTPAYSAALSTDVVLPADWKLHVVGVASGSRNAARNWTSDAPTVSFSQNVNHVQYGEGTADGTLFHLPSGDVKAAVGAGYRSEGYRQGWPGDASYVGANRHIAYAYGEAKVPLVAPSSTRVGLNAFDLSLSVRSERYSDVGSSTNPRIGLRYVPIPDLTLRATWGKSFKAPSFDQLYSQSYVFLWRASTLGHSGPGTALMTNGGNPDLKPERSTNWTLGGEYRPSALPSLKLAVTYFNIDYTDRIVLPVSNPTVFYSNPYYASFILPAPTAAAQAALIARSTFFYNFSGGSYSPSDVINLLEDSYVNAAAQTVNGVDFSYRQGFAFRDGHVDLFADATWLTLRQRTLPLLPEVQLSETLGYPPRLKARGGATWQMGQVTATAIANFISGEEDTGVTPSVPIASWTTVDANFAYYLPDHSGRSLKIIAAAMNLFDKRPPYATSPGIAVQGLAFDSTNSSIVGRVISLTVVKAW